ncbi:GNAT family protein [Nocardiopsis alba]|uniref:GNAT family N-acetyltransferase n=1 Tax=Nocardiopsis alba TaxID=53437 RepID=UPI0033F27E9F
MLVPHLETRRVVFRTATPDSADDLYDSLLRAGLETLPALDDFRSGFEMAVQEDFTLFAICLRSNGRFVGFGSLRDRDPAGHLKMGISMNTEMLSYGEGAEAMLLLANYGFARWEHIRRVYIESTEASIARFGAALSSLRSEVTLRDHTFFRGRLWDMHYYAVTRDEWERGGAPVLERLVPR